MLAPPMPRIRPATNDQPRRSPDGTEGYSCTLYKDYLVLYGGKENGDITGEVSVYNLKKKAIEQNTAFGACSLIPRVFSSACLNKEMNTVVYLGGASENFGRDPKENMTVGLTATREGLQWNLYHGIRMTPLPSPISNLVGKKMYLYQPDQSNGNFGSLYCQGFDRMDFSELSAQNEDMKELRAPSHNAIFSDNKLYLFAANGENRSLSGINAQDHLLEDVYVIDPTVKTPQWKRISTGGQEPGQLTDISITEANGVIYIFGSKREEGTSKACLWTYNTNDEQWNQVADIGKLEAKPNQRAVIYDEQLLIINWSFVTQTIQVQEKALNELNFIIQSGSNKRMCKDEPDELVQNFKILASSRLFHDVVFEVEGEEIPAHKALLAYRSDYFMKMFTSGMSESHSGKVTIPNMKSHIFKAILQYIYCNEAELDEQLALDLIPIVDGYLMKGLKGLCEKYLCKQLRKENVVDMLIVADLHEIDELKKACFKFILKNLGNIDESEEMMKLSKPLFFELLKFQTLGGQQNKSKSQSKEEEEKSNAVSASGRSGVKATIAPFKKDDNSFSYQIDFDYGFPTGSVSSARKRSKSPPMAIKKSKKALLAALNTK